MPGLGTLHALTAFQLLVPPCDWLPPWQPFFCRTERQKMISNENKSDLDLGLAYDLQMKLLTVMNGYEGKVCAAALAAALGSMLSRVASDDRQFVLNTVTSRAKNISDILVSARN